MPSPARVAVLASGGGSNLQALLDRFNATAEAPARVELVVGSREGIGALNRAARAGLPAAVLPASTPDGEGEAEFLLRELERHRIDLVVLAGYLRLVPVLVVQRYASRMVNVHPALLPAFGGPGMYGIRVHRAVLAAGVRVSGVTVHLVDERYDSGLILGQWPVPVLPDDTPESLAARVLAVEHRLLPLVVDRLARGTAPALPPTDPLGFEIAPVVAPSESNLNALVWLPAAEHAAGTPADTPPR